MFKEINGITERIIFFGCFLVIYLIERAICPKILAKIKVNRRSVLGIIISLIFVLIAFILAMIMTATIISL